MSVVTRDRVYCGIFGAPKQMSTSVLPTYTDVNKFYNLTKYEMKHEMNQKDPSHFAIAINVSKQIEFLWQKASIPISRMRIDYICRSIIMSNSLSASTLNCRNLSLFGASFFLDFLPDLKIHVCRYF